MKQFTVAVIVAFIALIALSCCASEDSASSDGINNEDITLLNEGQVSNFVYVLPDILDFSQKYQAMLSEDEKSSPDSNTKYFKALKQSEKIKSAYTIHQFKDAEELMLVYKNVVLAYKNIKTEFTNFQQDTEALKVKIASNEVSYQNEMKNTKLGREEKKALQLSIHGSENDKKLLENILLVKKYESELDSAVKLYQK